MTIIDAIKFNQELLKKLLDAGIKLEDVKYVNLFDDYSAMLAMGDKVSYIVIVLSGRYKVCERKVYQLIKHFQTPLKHY